jgi:hypothetical protein
MSRSDLKELGETLDAGTAGLIVVYEVAGSNPAPATRKSRSEA